MACAQARDADVFVRRPNSSSATQDLSSELVPSRLVYFIDGHAAWGTTARPTARHFGPIRARHGTVTRGLRAVLGPTSKPAGWPGPARVLGVGPVTARYHLHGHCTNNFIFMLHVFWCYFYDLRLRLWIWEVESCKKLIVTLCWWSDHCHCVVILFFLQNRATRAGTARSQPVGPCLGRRAGTRAAEARHGRHAGQIGTARYSPCPARARAGPARPGGHL